MAILVRGKTQCPLCGNVIEKDDDVVNFPPIFFNQRRAVWEVNDAAVHRGCLVGRPYGDAAVKKLGVFETRSRDPKVCRVCSRVIASPDDYFATGPLSDAPNESVAELDWFQAHLSCLSTWDGTEHLIELLDAEARSPGWEGDVLLRLADRLRDARGAQSP